MIETEEPGKTTRGTRANADWFLGWIREGAERTADMLTPPASAGRHFKQARIEFLSGVRELIDHRISHLSRDSEAKGTRVVVE